MSAVKLSLFKFKFFNIYKVVKFKEIGNKSIMET